MRTNKIRMLDKIDKILDVEGQTKKDNQDEIIQKDVL